MLSEGCTPDDPSNCPDSRGVVFQPTKSSTWQGIGLYQLLLTQESLLGYTGDNSSVGNDTVTLGWPGDSLPSLSHQIVQGIATKDFYIGSIGLSPHAVNITSLNDANPSFLGALVNESKIPSTSWAYTAGANYKQPTSFGSLTLGGYDSSRFIQNNVTFTFGPDLSRDLVVGIQSITSDAATSPLLSAGIYAFLDSLVPQIWLPVEVCHAFEKAFGLTYNDTAQLYFVNTTLHDKLVAQNANVTFKLGQSSTGGETVDIVLPYGSFDLSATTPLAENATKYFPLRQAQNQSQYTLGRAFFQNAYIIADYDRSNFSVSQALFPNGSNNQHIVAIHRPGEDLPVLLKKGHHGGAIAGIAIAVVVSLAGISVFAYWWRRKQRVRKATEMNTQRMEDEEYRKAELADSGKSEMPTSMLKEDNDHRAIFSIDESKKRQELLASGFANEMIGSEPGNEMPVGDESRKRSELMGSDSASDIPGRDGIIKRPEFTGSDSANEMPAHNEIGRWPELAGSDFLSEMPVPLPELDDTAPTTASQSSTRPQA